MNFDVITIGRIFTGLSAGLHPAYGVMTAMAVTGLLAFDAPSQEVYA